MTAATPESQVDPVDDATPPISVLVVDDHAMVADAFAAILSAAPDLRVLPVARDAEEALRTAERNHIDVALLDFALPTMDGIACAAKLRTLHPGIRSVILTGAVGDVAEIIVRAIDECCDGFLAKTDGASALVDAVRRAHAGEAVFSAAALSTAARMLRQKGSRTALSDREVEVLAMVARGVSTGEVAAALYISVHTVRSHIRHILEKLDAHSKLEAVAVGLREGLITVPRAT